MSAILNNKIEAVTFSIAKTAELALQYGDETLNDKKVFEKFIFDIASIASNAKIVDECIEKSKDAQNIEEFESKYRELRNNSNTNVRTSKYYEDWIEKISEIIGSSENHRNLVQDEDFEMTAEISDIDPITKKRMQNPLKNKICGHYYEKDSILQTISENRKYKCPIVGCTNKEIIKKTSLEEDLGFKLKLKRMLNRD
ncbi:E3 SUMO-protein ligase NSE2-like [Condylostylus longicornis]|uniref:E3 SUMO-protein ligase NSE2-like n=1 Tax=Condylostylus longicornis TaxID=2530218 RepID=UPI00244DB6CD|nr:E3 SUMO-protein ligase NSE2-like [Condylostylus longicornis]